jgi:DNA-binding NarL/FixJ family response regulator
MNGPVNENRIRLLLLDDHALFRTSLARLLATEADLEIAGECEASDKGLEILKNTTADVALMDFDPDARRAEMLISTARSAGYRGQFLMIADATDVDACALALKLGASGIFLKSEPPARLVQAIRLVAGGAIWLDPSVIHQLADHFVTHQAAEEQRAAGRLDERGEEVLIGILEGLTNRKIGMQMGLSESSVKNILQGLFAKAGVRTRSQLVRAALEGSLGAIHSRSSQSTG